MSKAEKYISDCTRNCSNELIAVESRAGKEVISYHEWLTPDQARKAVEIAREEMIEWLRKNYEEYQYKAPYNCFDIEQCIDDLKQAIKDEMDSIFTSKTSIKGTKRNR